jgi:hypothetical protein
VKDKRLISWGVKKVLIYHNASVFEIDWRIWNIPLHNKEGERWKMFVIEKM